MKGLLHSEVKPRDLPKYECWGVLWSIKWGVQKGGLTMADRSTAYLAGQRTGASKSAE